jgi:hypothetical protein
MEKGWKIQARRALLQQIAPAYHHASVSHKQQILEEFVATYGYWAVLLFVAIESTGIPFPGETMLLIAALAAGQSWAIISGSGLDARVASVSCAVKDVTSAWMSASSNWGCTYSAGMGAKWSSLDVLSLSYGHGQLFGQEQTAGTAPPFCSSRAWGHPMVLDWEGTSRVTLFTG